MLTHLRVKCCFTFLQAGCHKLAFQDFLPLNGASRHTVGRNKTAQCESVNSSLPDYSCSRYHQYSVHTKRLPHPSSTGWHTRGCRTYQLTVSVQNHVFGIDPEEDDGGLQDMAEEDSTEAVPAPESVGPMCTKHSATFQ